MPLNLDKFSQIAERYMLDTGRLMRPAEDSEAVEDPVTLEITLQETEIYNGQCMASPMGSTSQQDLGGISSALLTYEVAIPMSAPEPLANDYFEMLSSRDETLLGPGKRLRVIGFMPGTFAVSRRMVCRLEIDAA